MCIFGRPIRDFIPIHPGKYQPHTTWRETLQSREEALRNRHMQAAERLSEHTRVLPPLTVGDSVRIQNQTGPHPTKWDKTGIVVEVRQFDHYVIRVDGSGRTTLRNRKFLRKYVPVIPRTPILMAPGDRPVMCTPPATHTDPTSVNIPLHEPPPLTTTQAPSNTPCRPPSNLQPTTGSASTPLQQPPMTPDHDPSPGPVIEPLPPTPKATNSKAPVTSLARALRVLMPHNAPGLKEQAARPRIDPSPGAPRRSARLMNPSHTPA
ncbi:transcription factor iiib 90 kda subunit [Plakobranchus ocellatus]|uniref:Transcription factor iiib 90 kDa subunit n=1 Tax=Plakobranchus ocellatus TaxID=259542 RepID=A0AAV4CUU5_9GAST|nr:transcription factor iiib 90 kda subunit [Plakobranchus ocellatus]